MNKFNEYKELLKKEMQLYQKELCDELKNNTNYDITPVHGIKSNTNDRTDYMWIKVIVDNKEYWLTLFYNELDPNTGNMHTQIGRIQFCKGITNKTPNSFTKVNNKTIWYMNLDKYSEPKKRLSYVGDNPKEIVNDFIDFIKEDINE